LAQAQFGLEFALGAARDDSAVVRHAAATNLGCGADHAVRL